VAADPLHAFLDTLVAWLLTYAVHSTVLIAAAWVAAVGLARMACTSRRLRDGLPAIRERLWKLALVGGLVTAGAQTGFGIDPWGLQLALRTRIAHAETAPTAGPSAPETAPATHARHASAAGPAAIFAQVPPPVTSEPAAAPVWSGGWVGIVLALWGAGVLFGLMRWACQWNRLLRNLDDREPIVSGHVYEIFQHLRLRSGTRADVRLSAAPGLNAPITLGVRRCEICLPPRVATELQHDEIGALLAHELAHAERRDPLWVVACRAIEVVFFFQPLNRVCSSWLSDEAEYLCDDRAVVRIGERVALASCLTEIAGWIVHSTPTRLAPGMAAPGTRLSLRVGRLLDEDHDPNAAPNPRWFTLAVAPAALSVALLVPGVAAEARADEDEPEPAPVVAGDPPGLLERAHQLELDVLAEVLGRAGVDDVAPTPIEDSAPIEASAPDVTADPGASAGEAVAAEAAADEFAPLLDEIARLRAELATRTGGKSLARRIDAVEKQVRSLSSRALQLRARMDELEASAAPARAGSPLPVHDAPVSMFPISTKD
jgi:beta-lactamase regulating signal transducer with metallopeptidase domain